jgi:hypothetical protein
MALSRRHTRSRLGESRRQAKLFYQQILEVMDQERQPLNELGRTHAVSEVDDDDNDDEDKDEDEATLH